MKAIAIICEYNPFHNGHLALINNIKKEYPQKPIICFMSGEFVQRGEIATISAHERAKTAVLCGADAVIEIPTAYTLAPAEKYAECTLRLIAKTDLADTVAFGSELGSIEKLSEISLVADKPEFEERLSASLLQNTYPKARAAAFQSFGIDTSIIESPNNILAIEYISAIRRNKLPLTPITFKRTSGENIISATQIRGGMDSSKYMPESAYEIYKNADRRDEKRIERLVLSKLCDISGEFADVPDDFLSRIVKAARESATLDEYFEKLSVKQYTKARLRRMTYCAVLSVKKEEWSELPTYIKLLAANKKGTSAISKSSLPILSRYSAAEDKEFFEREAKRDLLAYMAEESPVSLSDMYNIKPYIQE